MLDIEKGLKGFHLSNRLLQLKREDNEVALLNLLLMLIKEDNLMSSIPFESLQRSKNEVESINIVDHTNNTELLARWHDMLQYLKIDVQRNSMLAYDFYKELYSESKSWKYALRAFLIVKFKKGIFKDRIPNIMIDCSSVLADLQYPAPYKTIISTIVCFAEEKSLHDFERDINYKLQCCVNENRYGDAIPYIESLELIGEIDIAECKKQKSKIFEKDADNTVANKKPNTYYPNIVDQYQKALKEISSLKDCEEDKKRISEKLIKEQEEFVKAMQLMGEYNSQKIDLWKIYKEIAWGCKASNSLSVFKTMISFPIINGEWISRQREGSKNNHQFLHKNFNTHVWHNSKGATTNIKNGDNAIEDSLRRIAQSLMIEYLKIFMMIIHSFDDCNVDAKYIHEHLEKLNSKFVPQDRIHLFVQGLWAGFYGDFALSSQILLPQMENSFRYIAQQHGILTTQLTKDIQNENTMGGVLEKIKPITNTNVWTELNHFLVEGVNFRNEAMHGLLSHRQLQHNGIYLWWLCLKIIYNTDNYFVSIR